VAQARWSDLIDGAFCFVSGRVMDEPGRRLAEQIRAAFHDVPGVDPEDLVIPRPDVCEREAVRDAFAPWTWKTIPGEVLLHEQGALSSLTPKGFRAFLPAYMLWSLSDPLKYGVPLDSVVFHLMPRRGWEAKIDQRLQVFSREELVAIRNYLGYMRDREADEFDLQDYDAAIGAVERTLATGR
jgi:hypothetical protein